MRLISFEYKDYSSEIKGLHFEEVSLIVGKNAVGKSRTISALRKAFQIILQKREIKSYDDFYYKLTFIEEDRELYYDFKCDYGSILSEHLTDSNDEEYISRDTDETIFYKDPINPPADKLTINVRRDTVKYPEVENIISWAEQSYGFLFNQIDIGYSENTSSYSIMSHSEGVITMFEQLDVNSRECVIKKMNELGYKIKQLEVEELGSNIKFLKIIEENVRGRIWQGDLSQGMQRTFYMIIYLHYIASKNVKAKTLVIDDFCEGLDYGRSIEMGKYVYNFCLENGIQLITTSNDSFLMDIVDLKYWNILQRDGEIITAINKYNSKELFDDFEFTGLNNFDLFSSDYIARHKK